MSIPKSVIVFAVVMVGIGLFSIVTINSETPSKTFEGVIPTITTVTPEISIIDPTISNVTFESFSVEPEFTETSSNLSKQGLLPFAYAVNSTQSSVTVKTWTGGEGDQGAFDSDWNHYSASTDNKNIIFINVTDNTTKTWILPNDNKPNTNRGQMGVDSSGHLWFSMISPNGSAAKLTKLNPITNVFTEYDIGNKGIIINIVVASSNEIFFQDSNGKLNKLDISQNKLVTWANPVGQSISLEIDSSGIFYLSSLSSNSGVGKIAKLNPTTNSVTTWSFTSKNVGGVNVDSSGNVFFTHFDGSRGNVGRITISDNTLTQWIIPNSNEGVSRDIGVDSNGNVFFGDNLTRLVPSTGIFTTFSNSCERIEIDSDDVIYCDNGFEFSEIT